MPSLDGPHISFICACAMFVQLYIWCMIRFRRLIYSL
jgi:hypothetical protein